MCPSDEHKRLPAATVADDADGHRRSNRQTDADAGHGVIDSRALFGSRQVLLIEHDGCRYRLSVTRQNKLILTK